MIQRWLLLVLVSGLSTSLWAYNRPNGEFLQNQGTFCGLIKSAYYKKDMGESSPQAIVTVVSQSQIVKIFSEELTLGFLGRVYPKMSVIKSGYNNLNNFRLTWSSSSMNDFYQLCLQGIEVQNTDKNPGMEFVSGFSSYQLHMN